MVHSRLPAGAASSACHLAIFTHPLEDTEEMTEYVTTCDGGVPLDTPVTSPPFFALIEPMEGRRDSATTSGPPRMTLSLGRSSHPPRRVCAGAWAAEHRAVRRLHR